MGAAPREREMESEDCGREHGAPAPYEVGADGEVDEAGERECEKQRAHHHPTHEPRWPA